MTTDPVAPVPAVEVFEEIDWAPKPILRPGMDYHDGTTYFTIPLTRNVVKMTKGTKDKPGTPVQTKELQTFTISSTHEGFWYDKEALDIEGFRPSEQVYQEQNTRWSSASAKAYLDGETPDVRSKDLFTLLRSIYTTYVEFSDEVAYDLMALFVMYTYAFRLFQSTGYVHFHGTQASGKSRNLAILNVLAFNTVWASSMSAASLYRKLAGSPGTSCIDETEGFDGERGEELRRILNAGYKDGAKVIRTEKTTNDRYVPVEYDVFGPKALASINPLEPVIASRCIVMGMRPAIRELPDFDTHSPRWGEVRDSLYLWAMANAQRLHDLTVEWRGDKKARLAPKLIGRQWETGQQFVILADLTGGEKFASRVIDYLNAYFIKQQDAANATDRLRTTLRALPRVLAGKAAHPGFMYTAKDIHEVISGYMEEDAKEYFKTKHVLKNLDTIGFRNKARATGGVRIMLTEEDVRRELLQRRVDPYPEDMEWLAGKVSYQNNIHPNDPKDVEPWWENDTEDKT